MKIKPFALERYFAKYEFSVKYLLSCSDCEPLAMSELLGMAHTNTLKMWETLKLSYTETPGHELLRESIAELYPKMEARETLVSAPEELIFLLMQALLEPGDHMICTFPGYQSLYEVARSMGCHVSNWTLDESKDWNINLQNLEGMLRENTRLVVANFPHNPTGCVPSLKEFELMVSKIQDRNIYLLSDEMYRFLEFNQDSRLPAACEIYHQAISLSGMSKIFGLPGLRIGWVVTHDQQVIEKMSLLKDYTTICNSAPSEILAIMALQNRDRIIGEQLERIDRNLKILDNFIQDYKNIFKWNRPQGGTMCFPRLQVKEGSFEFCEKLVSQAGIMLVPSGMFEYGDQHVRIGFGRENLPEVLDRFADYLDKYYC